MQWIHNYQLFLFDFDGLLVNTEELHFAAYIEMCKAHGFDLKWNFIKFCTLAHASSTGLRDALLEEFPALKAESWDVLYKEKKRLYLKILKENRLQLMPGVEKLLLAIEAAGIRRCVATNSALEQIEEIKRALPVLKTIPLWITREDYTQPKPAPDAYLAALQRLMQPGDKTIGFEDSHRGIKALQSANISPVLICPPDHPQLADPSLRTVPFFSSFEDIPTHGLLAQEMLNAKR